MLACPASELDEWQARRHRAAVKVQAHWRGLVQRRKLALRSPEMLRREQVHTGGWEAVQQSTVPQDADLTCTLPLLASFLPALG